MLSCTAMVCGSGNAGTGPLPAVAAGPLFSPAAAACSRVQHWCARQRQRQCRDRTTVTSAVVNWDWVFMSSVETINIATLTHAAQHLSWILCLLLDVWNTRGSFISTSSTCKQQKPNAYNAVNTYGNDKFPCGGHSLYKRRHCSTTQAAASQLARWPLWTPLSSGLLHSEACCVM